MTIRLTGGVPTRLRQQMKLFLKRNSQTFEEIFGEDELMVELFAEDTKYYATIVSETSGAATLMFLGHIIQVNATGLDVEAMTDNLLRITKEEISITRQ